MKIHYKIIKHLMLSVPFFLSVHLLSGQTPDKFKFAGDFRYRQQVVKEEGEAGRLMARVRARMRVTAALSENMDVIFGLGSGPSDADPATRNQTLSQAFSAKPVWLDLACFDWHPSGFEGFSVIGGKMPLPFFNMDESELVWDEDVTPEGLSARYGAVKGRTGLFGNAGYFFVQERKDSPDASMIAMQGGCSAGLVKNLLSFQSAIGYYNYYATRGHATFFDSKTGFGNSTDENGDYLSDFNELEWLGELEARFSGFPVSFFGHAVKNTAAKSLNAGWMAGCRLGECNELFSWSLAWQYRKLEKDAVIGAFAESDFAGGGTDNRGHEVKLSVQAGKGTRVSLAGYWNYRNLEKERDYRRIQADLLIKF
jgi:hypothetical protein